jgi:hypothetical protein
MKTKEIEKPAIFLNRKKLKPLVTAKTQRTQMKKTKKSFSLPETS